MKALLHSILASLFTLSTSASDLASTPDEASWSLTIPTLATFDPAQPKSVGTAFAAVRAYPLTGLPGDEDAAMTEPANLRLGLRDGALWFYIVASDNHLANRAEHFNDWIFRYGDTLELFVEKYGSREYFEFHFSPENLRLFSLWNEKAIQKRAEGTAKFEETLIPNPNLLDSFTWREGDDWYLLVRLPLALLEIPPQGGDIRLSVSRYNYDAEGNFKLSSSSAHTVINFHERSAWLSFRIPAPQ